MRELLLNNPTSRVKVAREYCQTITIDIFFEVKQTQVCIQKIKQLFKDLTDIREVSNKFMKRVKAFIEDWEELLKYHRKRTLSSMVNYDLSLCDMLKPGKHAYRVILKKQFPNHIRVEDDGFNDSEIAVPHAQVSSNPLTLTMKDTCVTIDSYSNRDSKVQLRKQSS